MARATARWLAIRERDRPSRLRRSTHVCQAEAAGPTQAPVGELGALYHERWELELRARNEQLRTARDERARLEVATDRAQLSAELEVLLHRRLGELAELADHGAGSVTDGTAVTFSPTSSARAGPPWMRCGRWWESCAARRRGPSSSMSSPHLIPTFKKIGELLGDHLGDATGNEVVNYRISATWGPLGHPDPFFPAPELIHAAARGRVPDLSAPRTSPGSEPPRTPRTRSTFAM